MVPQRAGSSILRDRDNPVVFKISLIYNHMQPLWDLIGSGFWIFLLVGVLLFVAVKVFK